MSSSAETSFDYDGVVWTCALLPYRIIACRDAIQYIVQVRNEKAYRSLSFFSEWEPIGRHYPQLATAGLPLSSYKLLLLLARGYIRYKSLRHQRRPCEFHHE